VLESFQVTTAGSSKISDKIASETRQRQVAGGVNFTTVHLHAMIGDVLVGAVSSHVVLSRPGQANLSTGSVGSLGICGGVISGCRGISACLVFRWLVVVSYISSELILGLLEDFVVSTRPASAASGIPRGSIILGVIGTLDPGMRIGIVQEQIQAKEIGQEFHF